jgi:hypothetical protein
VDFEKTSLQQVPLPAENLPRYGSVSDGWLDAQVGRSVVPALDNLMPKNPPRRG